MTEIIKVVLFSIVLSAIVSTILVWKIAPCMFGREKTSQCIELVEENMDRYNKEIVQLQKRIKSNEEFLKVNKGD